MSCLSVGELGDFSDVVEGVSKFSIRNSLPHLEHRDVHNFAYCTMVKLFEFAFTLRSEGPGFRAPKGGVQE